MARRDRYEAVRGLALGKSIDSKGLSTGIELHRCLSTVKGGCEKSEAAFWRGPGEALALLFRHVTRQAAEIWMVGRWQGVLHRYAT